MESLRKKERLSADEALRAGSWKFETGTQTNSKKMSEILSK